MKQILFLFGLVVLNVTLSSAQMQRALVIGINTYEAPPDYHTEKFNVRNAENLNGCVNDAKSISAVLNKKYGFQNNYIDTLYNRNATRNAILSSLQKLYDSSKEGDVAVLYYSGHGSHVKNSLTSKLEKQDQTIVPSDTYVDSVHDIRGPELNRYFNLFVDKKVKLTVIFDCCESGSLARGPNETKSKSRFLESEDWDALDASIYPAPEYRPGGFCMIMYASRSFEPAIEDSFDSVYHGAFTYSLLKAIGQQPINASANSIFQSARSILKNMPKPQEPLIAGDSARLNETLFGQKISKFHNYEGFAVEDVSSINIENNEFAIQIGFANQVSKKTQLVALYDSSKNPLTVEIISIVGLNSSIVKCIQGDSSSIKAGMLFRISSRVAEEEKLLKLFLPQSKISKNLFNQYLLEAIKLKQSKKIKWVTGLNLDEKGPFATVFWKDQHWWLKMDSSKAITLTEFSAKAILDLCIKQEGFKKDSSIYLEMPIEATVSDAILKKLKNQISPYFQIVDQYDKAHYAIFSTIAEDNSPIFGIRRTVISKPIDLDPLPLKTNMSSMPQTLNVTDDSLLVGINKLAKIFYWVNLTYPIDENKFIYHLEMFQRDSLNPVMNNRFIIGDKLTLSMIKTENQDGAEDVPPNYYHITVFRVSPDGSIVCFKELLNEVNTFPKAGDLYNQKKIDIVDLLTTKYLNGVYTYFLIASHEPFDYCSQVQQSAVFGQNKTISRGNGIAKQFIQKISFRAVAKPN
jgi:hypothetical protein